MAKGVIKWVSVNEDTNEVMYELGQEEIDTKNESVRDTIVRLLISDWDTFGESGDSIIIDCGEDEDD